MHLKLNDWEIPCIAIEQLDYNLYKVTTNSETAYTYTWAWLTGPRMIKKSIPSFVNTKVSGKIDMEQYSFIFNGSIESIESHNYFYDFKTYTIIIRLVREALNINV